MRSTNSLYGKDILDISALTRADIELIFQTAQIMKKRLKQKIKKSSYLKGKAIINLFCEPSTRTRTSFELAGKYLGADVINFSTSASSLLKGESFRDTLLTLQAMHCDGVILRHPVEGAAVFAARELAPVVINAGDGAHAHPTQALLDGFTLREKGLELNGLKMVIVGDILHSRVARSNIALWKKYGADIHVCGPATLIPHDIEQLGVSVHDRIEDADKRPSGHPADVYPVNLRHGWEDPEHGVADAGRKNAEGDKIGERVDLDAIAPLLQGTVLLGAGHFSVKCVAQSGDHEKEYPDEGVPLSVHADQDPQNSGDQRSISKQYGIIIKTYHTEPFLLFFLPAK